MQKGKINMKSYYVELPEKTVNYLERLDYEVSAKQSVIDYIMTSHKDDADASVLEGAPFKHYAEELEKSIVEYTKAKKSLSDYLMPLVCKREGRETVAFDWIIEDFADKRVKIMLKE